MFSLKSTIAARNNVDTLRNDKAQDCQDFQRWYEILVMNGAIKKSNKVGSLIHAINCGEMSVEQAKAELLK